MSSVLFPQDELFNEEEHFIYIPPVPKVAPPFPNTPFIDGPHGGLLSERDYEIAMFLAKAARLNSSMIEMATKLQSLLRFQLWQKNRHIKEERIPQPISEDPCLLIETASREELDALLCTFCSALPNDPDLKYLREAILLARIDSRMYIAQKETIEQLLKETVTFDEELVPEQKQRIQKLLSEYADRYSQALSTAYVRGVEQKESLEIQKILLLAVNERNSTNPAIQKYSEKLSELLSLGNTLKSAYLEATPPPQPPSSLSLYTSSYRDKNVPFTDNLFSTTAFLLFFIKSSTFLQPFETELTTLLQQGPAFLALGIDYKKTLEKTFLVNDSITPLTCALTEALNAHMAVYILQAHAWPFLDKIDQHPIAPLLTLQHLFQSLLGDKKEAEYSVLAAWCTYIVFSEIVEALIENPDQHLKELSPWSKPFLTPVQFFEELFTIETNPAFCYATWTKALFSAPSSPLCYESYSEAFSILPSKNHIDIQSLLKKIITTRHIREEKGSKEIRSIVEFLDELIENAFPGKKGLSSIQLYQAAAEQAERIQTLCRIKNSALR